MKRNGFTIIELMITVSVLGIVLAVGTPPVVHFVRHRQSKDCAAMVMGILRQARSGAIRDGNAYVVFFDTGDSRITVLDDDGGAGSDPGGAGFDPAARDNGRIDQGEKIEGPFELPEGQVFGMIRGVVGPDDVEPDRPITFSGSPPRVVFYPDGSANEEGMIFVMPELEFREQRRGTDQVLVISRSTGSVSLEKPRYRNQ